MRTVYSSFASIFGFIPIFLIVMAWNDGTEISAMVLKQYSIPIVIFELIVTTICLNLLYKNLKVRLPTLAIIFAFSAYILFLSSISQAKIISYIYTLIFLNHLIFGLSIFFIGEKKLIDRLKVANYFQVGFILFFVILILKLSYTGFGVQYTHLDLPAFNNIRHLSQYAAAIVGFCALGFMTGQRLAIVTSCFAFTLIFWTGSRGAIVSTILAWIVMAVLYPRAREKGPNLRFFASLFVGFLASLVMSAGFKFEGQGPERMAMGGSSGRVELWLQTIESILQHPWIGRGSGQFIYGPGSEHSFLHPHNVLLQVLYDWGVVGALFIAVITVIIGRKALIKLSSENISLIYVISILTVYSFISGALFWNTTVYIFAICISLILSDRGGINAHH